MINQMVREYTLGLMEESMKGNSRMGKNMVKEYGLLLMEEKLSGNGRRGNYKV